MTNFAYFAENCKMRHDFGDMIQVRYTHTDGEHYDTWVSGEEVLQRVKSSDVEDRIRSLSQLDLDTIRKAAEDIPGQTKNRAGSKLTGRIADEVEDFLGDHLIGESLADGVRGNLPQDDLDQSQRQRWRLLLQDDRIRLVAIELAWIQLEGSFPENEADAEPDDWI